jgi:GDP-mannose 4,6-dehydratase
MEKIQNCRLCKNSTTDILSLGEQYITSRFPIYGDFSTPKTSITLCMCQNCGLVQLKETTDSNELYEYEYGYRSGISNTMRTHLKQYQEEILTKIHLSKGDIVVDIGSNDSTMLQYYSNDFRRIGVDPTGKQFAEYYGDVELLPTYFTYENFTNAFGNINPKMVSSICMFYDLPDPVQFAKDIHSILHEDGIWTCEQSYLPTMIKTNSIDTICHEHLEYYSLHQVKSIADRAGFSIIDVKFNDSNGGSFRVYFAKTTSNKHIPNTTLVNDILNEECEYGVMNLDLYRKFMENVNIEVSKLRSFIETVISNGKSVYIYGASTKGNCLLQYANLDETYMKYAVERNPNKIGKMTSTGIKIIGEDKMRESPPDYLFVLPWHFRDEIIVREHVFLENGGQFIFPFPHFEVIGSKPKLLLTGCDGMISHYIKERFTDYNLYGITRTLDFTNEKNITKFCLDMNDDIQLEHTLSIVKPDVILHMASISSSQYAYNNPLETIMSNGVLTVKLCDMIHKHGWNTILFNASSSEIYKGHVDYIVSEDDTNMYHLHPYSIAKTMGHNVVKFYRDTYNLPFSNGVIFTTESPQKKPHFLLNKVAKHIADCKANDTTTPLVVGDLSSYRNILHASDVVNAIHLIISQEKGEDYLICNTESYKVYDLVLKLYENANIELEQLDNILYKKGTHIQVVIMENKYSGVDALPTNIKGYPTKLLNLGWNPIKSINSILLGITSFGKNT